MATIEQARAAISRAHAAEGLAKGDNPAQHPVVAEVVKGWRNQAPAPSPPRPWHASGRPPGFPGAALVRAAVDLAIIGAIARVAGAVVACSGVQKVTKNPPANRLPSGSSNEEHRSSTMKPCRFRPRRRGIALPLTES